VTELMRSDVTLSLWNSLAHLAGNTGFYLSRSVGTLYNRLFSEPPTVYRGKHAVLRHFRRSYLKANEISKSEWIRKVE